VRAARGRPDISILAADEFLNLWVVFEDATDLLCAQKNHAAPARKFSNPASPEESVGMQQFDTGDRACRSSRNILVTDKSWGSRFSIRRRRP
jgi:hypothetical protein